jgi:hypothetical protein
MRFEEGSTISQAIALIMTMRNAAERLRHPTNQPAFLRDIYSSDQDEVRQVIQWIVENPS